MTLAPPDNAVVGAEEIVNCVALVMDNTRVPGLKAPVPAFSSMDMPTESPSVLATVTVVDAAGHKAPAAEVYALYENELLRSHWLPLPIRPGFATEVTAPQIGTAFLQSKNGTG